MIIVLKDKQHIIELSRDREKIISLHNQTNIGPLYLQIFLLVLSFFVI